MHHIYFHGRDNYGSKFLIDATDPSCVHVCEAFHGLSHRVTLGASAVLVDIVTFIYERRERLRSVEMVSFYSQVTTLPLDPDEPEATGLQRVTSRCPCGIV